MPDAPRFDELDFIYAIIKGIWILPADDLQFLPLFIAGFIYISLTAESLKFHSKSIAGRAMSE